VFVEFDCFQVSQSNINHRSEYLARQLQARHAMLQIEKPTTITEKRHYLLAWCASRYLKCSACYFYNSLSGPAHQYLWSCGFQLAQNPDYVSFRSGLRFSGTSECMCYKCLIADAVHLTRRFASMTTCSRRFISHLLRSCYTTTRLGSTRHFTQPVLSLAWPFQERRQHDMQYPGSYLDFKRNGRLPEYV
jgi:hypothetical protein